MKRYYLTEWRQGHLTSLKVYKGDIISTTNWNNYMYIDLPDNPASDVIACKWRDEVIEGICNASLPFGGKIDNSSSPITPNGFSNYRKSFDAQP